MVNVYNVIARIEGIKYPDQWIIRGSHHDAWVSGATDPTSGMVVMLAEAKAISTLVKMVMNPKEPLCLQPGTQKRKV